MNHSGVFDGAARAKVALTSGVETEAETVIRRLRVLYHYSADSAAGRLSRDESRSRDDGPCLRNTELSYLAIHRRPGNTEIGCGCLLVAVAVLQTADDRVAFQRLHRRKRAARQRMALGR